MHLLCTFQSISRVDMHFLSFFGRSGIVHSEGQEIEKCTKKCIESAFLFFVNFQKIRLLSVSSALLCTFFEKTPRPPYAHFFPGKMFYPRATIFSKKEIPPEHVCPEGSPALLFAIFTIAHSVQVQI